MTTGVSPLHLLPWPTGSCASSRAGRPAAPAMHRTRTKRGAMSKTTMLVAGLIVGIAVAAPPAHAAASLTIDPTGSQRVAVGQQNVTFTIALTNANSGADSSLTVCNAGDGAACTGSNGIT